MPVKASRSSKKTGKRKEMDVDLSQATAGGKRRKRTNRTITPPPGTGRDDDGYEMVDDGNETPTEKEGPLVDLEIEEDEKPKPILGLTYQGFNIYGHCLCLVVEPWPAIRSTTVAPNLEPGQTPLFLPETGTDFSTEHPAEAAQVNQPYLDRILNDGNVSDEDEFAGGMMDFSQVLNSIGDARPGAVNDDDDIDNSILFGDADEFKEL
ncbi:hypothetical protein M413DRAFT_441141 [Hebeloma cylindrosporum]|uniref:Uncharacterized protein n=1 Tax=Hebeloma cylindrosporum TaxID=76867 RepID=A0A0C2Y8B5_HEBCY|nr:hypothetical protein M413DRAFT_441141 [Hebeloma cylindrosporum h7]